MKPSNVLLLPDWRPEPGGWLAGWEWHHGYRRVQQHDVQHPLRGDWLMCLEESVLRTEGPLWLVGRGLGCHLVASWAGHSRNASRVLAAFLVSPNDPGAVDCGGALHSWMRVHAGPLPFPTLMVLGSASPATGVKARSFAAAWGSAIAECEEGPAAWPQGHRLFQERCHLLQEI